MNRKELYTGILSTILLEYPGLISNVEDVKDELNVNGLVDALTLLKTNLQEDKLKYIVESMNTNCNDDELINYEKYTAKRESYQQISQKRDFEWKSPELIIINCDRFTTGNAFTNDTMLAFEKICFDENKRKDFLNYILHNDGKNDYYLIYDDSWSPGVDSWKLYMYGLFMHTNDGNSIKTDPTLNYVSSQHNPTVVFNGNAKYEQYIDIYDVISEWNESTDILTAFLKMYQVLEYMVYRKEFVAIVEGSKIKQSFVRQIKGLDKKFSNGERETFVKGVSEVISSFNGEISDTLITPDISSFCQKYFPKNRDGSTYMKPENIRDSIVIDGCVSKFIYDVRCSIVHNKESEFHMTSINYDEYSSIVPLMSEIMKVVGKKVMETINDENNKICFPDKSINLY